VVAEVRAVTRYPIVAIEWVDAHADSGWMSIPEAEKLAKAEWYCTDVGILIKETPKVLVFAQRLSPPFQDGQLQIGSLHRIPKTWVRRRIVLGYLKANGRAIRREAHGTKSAQGTNPKVEVLSVASATRTP
jgi:hypothetical protein